MSFEYNGIKTCVASTAQAILDFFEVAYSDMEAFNRFLRFVSDRADSMDLAKVGEIAVRNGQYRSLAKFGFVLEHILDRTDPILDDWKRILD